MWTNDNNSLLSAITLHISGLPISHGYDMILQITLFADFCFLNTLNILVGACLGLGNPCCDIPHHIFSQGIQAGRCLCVRGCGIKGKLNEQPHK